MNIILLGPPGAGKGTQAKLIADEFKLVHISTGDIFRAEIKNKTPLGERIKSYMDSGNLVPDSVVLETIRGVIEKTPNTGYLFDGFPRTIAQAEGLSGFVKIDFVVYINLTDNEIIKRLTSRRSCVVCSRNYNIATGPFPRQENRCDVCGGELVLRSDDLEPVIKERLNVYRKNTSPLIEYYKKLLPSGFFEIDGSRKIEEVYRDIKDKLSWKA